MRVLLVFTALMIGQPVLAADAGKSWLSHVQVLADDNMEGRLTGTPGYDRAAAYVAEQFRKLGLKPAGDDGFRQAVAFKEQSVDLAASRLMLDDTPLAVGETILPGASVPQLPRAFDSELVFLGYGLRVPDAGHDDFAGQDLKGKIVVILRGGPKDISGALRSHAQSAEYWPALQAAGAAGSITIQNPGQMDVPWERTKSFASTPGMRLADEKLNNASRPFFTASFSPAEAEILFAKSGRTFAEMVKLADAGEVLPRFSLNRKLSGWVKARDRELTSPNVVGLLPGRDPKLAGEYVVLTGHLDHVGVDKPVNGDAIYNGAMDNAAGIATMIEVGRELVRKKPKRSVIFLALTAEERGLLGSRYYAARPTVPKGAIVANINMDMYLPLWPFKAVTALGAEESSLGPVSARVAKSLGVMQLPDAEPWRNLFVRSDQYSFVREGVPALALKFAPTSPQEKAIEKDWLTYRYHAPGDDLNQPISPEHAVQFNRYLGRLILTVANAPERPVWNPDSFFRRFAE